ncbi:hypothetical protein [Sediminibacterium goheungense]|uniref:Uncharacterized protein n=1 Tax=Sediminibacterium goheungense TaxID=1086393 RepID=A0A4R6IVY7_9BACT|nr:hypothetical protein [Sediminibacterium goheungense]TDO26844.1 hypothetical protein BC659_2156 [Sediminibacterium goheungense]
MELDFREKQRKSYRTMRMIYDLSMAVFILGMAFVLLLAEQLKIEQIMMLDPMYRYLMGSVSVLYGAFRLYRGIKRDY